MWHFLTIHVATLQYGLEHVPVHVYYSQRQLMWLQENNNCNFLWYFSNHHDTSLRGEIKLSGNSGEVSFKLWWLSKSMVRLDCVSIVDYCLMATLPKPFTWPCLFMDITKCKCLKISQLYMNQDNITRVIVLQTGTRGHQTGVKPVWVQVQCKASFQNSRWVERVRLKLGATFFADTCNVTVSVFVCLLLHLNLRASKV